MHKLIALAVGVIDLPGCATHATLSVLSQPPGAYITEKGSGKALGMAPVNSYYEGASLQGFKDTEGCYLVQGLEARWVSGARGATMDSIRLCGGSTDGYYASPLFQLSRWQHGADNMQVKAEHPST